MLKLTLFIICITVANFAFGNRLDNNIYRDIETDAPNENGTPFRLKLKRQSDLSLGRVAGVWGSVGLSDSSDAFFLGKTPEKTRLRFSLSSASNTAGARLTVIEKNGQETTKHELWSRSVNTEKWLTVSGQISVVIASEIPDKQSIYALYIWYPGERVDSLSDAQVDDMRRGDVETPTFIRQLKDVSQ